MGKGNGKLKPPQRPRGIGGTDASRLVKSEWRRLWLEKVGRQSHQIYQVYCQFNLESLPKNLIDDGIRKLLAKGLLI